MGALEKQPLEPGQGVREGGVALGKFGPSQAAPRSTNSEALWRAVARGRTEEPLGPLLLWAPWGSKDKHSPQSAFSGVACVLGGHIALAAARSPGSQKLRENSRDPRDGMWAEERSFALGCTWVALTLFAVALGLSPRITDGLRDGISTHFCRG